MFQPVPDETRDTVTITIDGRPVAVPRGISAAAAALGSGLRFTRRTPRSGAKRAPFCMMGVCFDCVMIIDGRPNQRACATTVTQGMTIETQDGTGPEPRIQR